MKALITGASSGIGREFAKLLAHKGYDLILVARDEDKLNTLKKELNTNIKTITVDLSIEDNCKKLYAENPDIDLLINNAGFGDCGNFTNTSLDKEISMINTNITAYHILTKLYLIDMKKVNKGHILNVASIAGFMPGPLMATYYATKSYVVRLSEGIREELKKENSNVKISILCPGPVKTNFSKVANVKFNLREASSYSVAKYAIDHLNSFYIIPGIDIKFARLGAKLFPSSLVAKVTYMIQKKKLQ
jgi:short-subunit dehydrogenase